MASNKQRTFVRPGWKIVLAALVVAVVGNIIGKWLAPNGPSSSAKGIVGTVGMGVFFVLLVYLLIICLLWAASWVTSKLKPRSKNA